MVKAKGDGGKFVSGFPGRGPRITRYSLTGTRPTNLPQVIAALLSEQPRRGYPDKNAVMGVLNGCGYKVKGERDDLYRFLLNHGVVLCPDDFGLAVHVCDPEEAQLLRDAYNDKCDQPPITAARCRANYLVLLHGLGYQLVAPSGERVAQSPPTITNQEPAVLSPARPQDLYDVLDISDLRDAPDLIRAMSEVELDGIMERIHRLELERDTLIELVTKDKARRQEEAEQSRQRELRRREIDERMTAATAELERVKEAAKTAQLQADQAIAARKNVEQHLKRLERERALL